MIAHPSMPPENRQSFALPTMPGAGIRAMSNAVGESFSVPAPVVSFGHPFTPYLASNVVTFSRGLVDVLTPKIGGVPMTDPKARLKLDPKKVNQLGESFLVLEVDSNSKGLLDANSRIEIVQDSEPDLHSDTIGRQPLALVIFNGDIAQRVFALTFFNLKYQMVKATPGGGLARHFFL